MSWSTGQAAKSVQGIQVTKGGKHGGYKQWSELGVKLGWNEDQQNQDQNQDANEDQNEVANDEPNNEHDQDENENKNCFKFCFYWKWFNRQMSMGEG